MRDLRRWGRVPREDLFVPRRRRVKHGPSRRLHLAVSQLVPFLSRGPFLARRRRPRPHEVVRRGRRRRPRGRVAPDVLGEAPWDRRRRRRRDRTHRRGRSTSTRVDGAEVHTRKLPGNTRKLRLRRRPERLTSPHIVPQAALVILQLEHTHRVLRAADQRRRALPRDSAGFFRLGEKFIRLRPGCLLVTTHRVAAAR